MSAETVGAKIMVTLVAFMLLIVAGNCRPDDMDLSYYCTGVAGVVVLLGIMWT